MADLSPENPVDLVSADFPVWLRAAHLINFVLIGILLRSGIEILSSLPRLWWRNDCAPGTEWLRFTRRKLPREEGVYTSLMDEKTVSPLLALPGRENIGLGRHWHGLGVMLWVLNGVVYVILLLATGLWRRIVPTSWEVFPDAWESFTIYLGLGVPSIEHFTPYDALQQLAYTAVVFLIAPLMIATGIAMSPTVRNRFPWYVRMWGGHQGARSLHFLGVVAMSLFVVVHVGLVFLVHPEYNLPHMVFGVTDPSRYAQAFTVAVATVVVVIGFWIALSYWTLADRARAHRILVPLTEIGRRMGLGWVRMKPASPGQYTEKDLSAFHWTNGLPPTADESPYWVASRERDFADYAILVKDATSGRERRVTLEEITRLPRTEYVTTTTCMQGWSATSKFAGARLRDVLALLGERPPGARFAMATSYGLAQKMYDNRPREPFYSVIDLEDADSEMTVLVYERNDHPLDTHLGGPLRLRVESSHGYKMTKWVAELAWIEDYAEYGDGRGGTREDSALQAFNGRI